MITFNPKRASESSLIPKTMNRESKMKTITNHDFLINQAALLAVMTKNCSNEADRNRKVVKWINEQAQARRTEWQPAIRYEV